MIRIYQTSAVSGVQTQSFCKKNAYFVWTININFTAKSWISISNITLDFMIFFAFNHSIVDKKWWICTQTEILNINLSKLLKSNYNGGSRIMWPLAPKKGPPTFGCEGPHSPQFCTQALISSPRYWTPLPTPTKKVCFVTCIISKWLKFIKIDKYKYIIMLHIVSYKIN